MKQTAGIAGSHAELGCVLHAAGIGMHCRILGRPGRLRALQRFLDHVQRHDRVWVTRRIDIARHWKAVHPFDPSTAFIWE